MKTAIYISYRRGPSRTLLVISSQLKAHLTSATLSSSRLPLAVQAHLLERAPGLFMSLVCRSSTTYKSSASEMRPAYPKRCSSLSFLVLHRSGLFTQKGMKRGRG